MNVCLIWMVWFNLKLVFMQTVCEINNMNLIINSRLLRLKCLWKKIFLYYVKELLKL